MSINAGACCANRCGRQIGIECQIKPHRAVLQPGQQQHLHRIEADGAKPQRVGDGVFDLMLVEVLHQAQHLDELAPSGVAHPGFYKPSQTMDAFGQLPAVQGRCLIERLALELVESDESLVISCRLVILLGAHDVETRTPSCH